MSKTKPTKEEVRRVMSDLGRRGSRARMEKTTHAQRVEVARKAGLAGAKARWKGHRKKRKK